MCTPLEPAPCSSCLAPVAASRARSTARPAPTGPVRVSTPLILLDTSGLLDPVTGLSTCMGQTLGRDANHICGFYDPLDDAVRGEVLHLHPAGRGGIIHGEPGGPHFQRPHGGEQR